MKSWRIKLGGSEFKVMRLQEEATAEDVLDTPDRVVAYLRPKLGESIRFANTRRRPIGFEIISNGTLDTLLVHARQVFRPAIIMNAAGVVIFHNHPSGDPTPSEADINVTRQLVRAGQILKIDVCDHVILGQPSAHSARGWCSLRELGYFNSL